MTSLGDDRRAVAVTGAVVLAAAVRLAGLGWGLPDDTHFFSYHPDEFSVAGTVNGMLNTGELNPRFFHYGSLMIYLTALVTWPLHAAGIVTTVVGTHVVARLLTIALGAATVALTAALAGRVAGRGAAIVAALFLALMPGHVLHSGFATVDVPAGFFVALSLLLTLRAGASMRGLALAGAAAGLAAATKYNAGVVLLAPVVLALRERALPPGRRIAHVGVCAAAALVAFLVAMPFAVLDFDEFRSDVTYELVEHAGTGHLDVFTETGNGWWYHATTNLPYLAGVPLALLALWGIVRMGRRRAAPDWALIAFAVPYFAGLGLSEVRFLRYLLPLAPVIAVAAAYAVGDRRRGAARIAVAVALLSLVVLTGRQQAAFATDDPRAAAARWLDENAPPGTAVGLASVPWHHTPSVTPWNGGQDTYAQFVAYEEQRGRYRFVVCRDWNRTMLEREQPEFFLLSEFERRDEERLGREDALSFLRSLETRYRPAARFERFPGAQRRLFGPAFAPHDWLYPFARVTVWRRAGDDRS